MTSGGPAPGCMPMSLCQQAISCAHHCNRAQPHTAEIVHACCSCMASWWRTRAASASCSTVTQRRTGMAGTGIFKIRLPSRHAPALEPAAAGPSAPATCSRQVVSGSSSSGTAQVMVNELYTVDWNNMLGTGYFAAVVRAWDKTTGNQVGKKTCRASAMRRQRSFHGLSAEGGAEAWVFQEPESSGIVLKACGLPGGFEDHGTQGLQGPPGLAGPRGGCHACHGPARPPAAPPPGDVCQAAPLPRHW